MTDPLVAPAQIDPTNCGEVAAQLARPGDGDVVLDCSSVEFIDSSGLRALIEGRTRLAADGRALVIRQPSAVLARLLEITDTEHLFTIER